MAMTGDPPKQCTSCATPRRWGVMPEDGIHDLRDPRCYWRQKFDMARDTTKAQAREEAYEAMRAALTPGSSDHDWDGLVSWAEAALRAQAEWMLYRQAALKLAEKVRKLNEARLRALALAEQADA